MKGSMKPQIDDSTLEHPLTQFAVREAVSVALDSPLREPILDAVDDAERTPERQAQAPEPESGDGRGTNLVRGLAVVAVLGAVTYVTLRKLTGGAES